MAKFNLKYYNDKDLYTDGDIEEEMLRLADIDNVMDNLKPSETDFAVLYHFSPIRENIVNWYPFKEESTVLEVGAGCGAITGTLCRAAKKVIAVELSKRRAEINYKRHKNYDNLEIFVGNFNDMHFGQEFDYVILNGVFEYAINFTDGSTPYVTFLKKMAELLKTDGRILIAIENRLGLKYFAGAPEDHTEIYFLGQNKYLDYDKVRTFSKKELIDIFNKCELKYHKFYYPYPDYKFPNEIFTDVSIKSQHYGKSAVNLSKNRIHFFNENILADSLVKEEVMDTFANSFLVEVGKDSFKNDIEIEYVKLNADRKPEFRIATLIENVAGKRIAVKKALTKDAEEHINRLFDNQEKTIVGNHYNLQGEKEKNGEIVYPYLELETIDNELCTLIERKDKTGILHCFQDIFRDLFEKSYEKSDIYSERFAEVFGMERRKKVYHCLDVTNIDIICDNVFADKEKYYLIDCEWIFNFSIPLEFVVWRSLNELYSKHIELYDVIEKNEFMHLYNIDKKDERIFLSWSYHFAYEYVGSDSLNKFAKDVKHIALEEIVRDINRKESYLANLYYDTGFGFNEEQKIEAHLNLCDGEFCVEYDLIGIDNIKSLRWDPIEYHYCICKVEFDSAFLECNSSNALITIDEGDLFATEDPNYYFSVINSPMSNISFTGKLRILDIGEILQQTLSLYHEECCVAEEQRELQRELDTVKTQEIKRLEHELAESNFQNGAFSNSFSWRITAPARKMGRLLRKCRDLVFPKKDNIKRKQIEVPLVSLVKYSIDKADYSDGLLNIQGWIFCEKHKIQHVRLLLINSQENVVSDAFELHERDDVKVVFNIDFEGNCGLNAIWGYESAVECKIGFQLRIDNEDILVETNIVIPPTGNKETKISYIGTTEFTPEYQEVIRHFIAMKETGFTKEYLDTTIDVVVPVYNGFEYLEKLFYSISQTRMKYRLLIIEDCSTDSRVRPFLEEYAAAHNNVVLLLNEENMGFVKSVNRALAISENHVALVNTDVEVPAGWLERLMNPIINEKKVASSTPFTNSGTIFSFPNMGTDNDLVADLNVNQIDSYFSKIKPSYVAAPTGVGFCMGMNMSAMKEIGLLDDINFEKGYGEENDWCQRSISAGYRNVYVENLFVYHNHGGSFPSEEKQKLLEINGKRLQEKHPRYLADIARFCNLDPNRNIRKYVYFDLLSNLSEIRTIVAFDHKLGGGATAYLEKYKLEHIQKNDCFIIIRYDISQNVYLVECAYKNWNATMRFRELADIQKTITGWRMDLIIINELVSYPELYNWLQFLVSMKYSKHCELRMLLHDYYAICPTINLWNSQHMYCKVPDCMVCEECVKTNPEVFNRDYQTMDMWRKTWGKFLTECDEVRVFSCDSKKLLLKVYPLLKNIHYLPHQTDYMYEMQKRQKINSTMNVGILGVISEKKGLGILKELVEQSCINHDNICFVVIGEVEGDWKHDKVIVTGRYEREEIPKLVLKYDVDLFLIPSIWPETFSYTTDEIMKMHMPIAVFNIGAPAERVSLYDKGCVISYPQDSKKIYEELVIFAETVVRKYKPACGKNVLFIADYLSYSSRYRVEHLQEQLSFKGINSCFMKADEVGEKHVKLCSAIAFYRCKYTQEIDHIVECARQRRIPVYYDIDDYIFEYDKINSLDIWTNKEYENFEEECMEIKHCMKLADVYLVSTEQLKKAVLESFPYAEVHVNRNHASIEMHMLSEKALNYKYNEDGKFVISYFSGSKTHDKDLELISDVLRNVLDKYSNVELLFGGCIKIPSVLCKYVKRIKKMEFVDWKLLPSLIAQSNLTLMPLECTFFHSCKSENKWMEAALVKIPTIASYNDELAGVINNNIDGVLCKTEEEWEKAICQMIEQPEYAQDIALKAYDRVRKEYLTTELQEDILDLFM